MKSAAEPGDANPSKGEDLIAILGEIFRFFGRSWKEVKFGGSV